MVTLYTKQHCPQCKATKRRLGKIGVDYKELDAMNHLEELKSLGFMAAPVVITDNESWSGYRPEMIDSLV
jgi:glutaredoxin-like protein NrdH